MTTCPRAAVHSDRPTWKIGTSTTSSAIPISNPGTTMGMRMRLIRSPLPRKRPRTRPKAHSVPTGTATAVAMRATMRLLTKASRTKNSSWSRRYHLSDIPVIGNVPVSESLNEKNIRSRSGR